MPNGVNPSRSASSDLGEIVSEKYPLTNSDGSPRSIKKGHGVDANTSYPKGHNAYLQAPDVDGVEGKLGRFIRLYVTDVELSLEMGGEAVQSPKIRQFFSSNLVQPSINISGIAPSSYHYNNLANYVRKSQDLSVETGELMRFRLYDTAEGIGLKNFPYDGRNTKGKHEEIKLQGYIQTMQAGARKENHAPEWQMTIMIVVMEKGPWDDELVTGTVLRPWIDIFSGNYEKAKEKSFVQQPKSKKSPGTKPKKIPNFSEIPEGARAWSQAE